MTDTHPKTGSHFADAIMDFLINIPLFDNLSSDELRLVSRYMNVMDVKPGEIVFKEGEPGNYVCFVAKGTLDVLKISPSGKEAVLATLGKNRSIGEMSVIDDRPRSATIRVKTDATLVILTRDRFDLIMKEHAKAGIKILKGLARLLSQNLRKTSSRLADYMLPLH